MARLRRPAVQPIRQLADFDSWAGRWIAVKDGEVIAADYDPSGLVRQVREKGARARGSVAQFVPPRTDEIVVGVG